MGITSAAEEVLAVQVTAEGEEELLIKSVGLPDFENSWEEKRIIMQEFPQFHFGDKVGLQGGYG